MIGSSEVESTIPMVDFASFAGTDEQKWKSAIGSLVLNRSLGVGELTAVERLQDGRMLFMVRFSDEEDRFFCSDAGQYFVAIAPSAGLHAIPFFTTPELNRLPSLTRQWRELKRQAELDEERRKGAEATQQRQEEEARQQRERERFLEEQRIESERLQLQKELHAVEEFRLFREKYEVFHKVDGSPVDPLFKALHSVDNFESLDTDDITVLEKSRAHLALATFYDTNFTNGGDPWDLVKACSNLRKARRPSEAIAKANILLKHPSQRTIGATALAALFTSRGGAFRDLSKLELAEESARCAVERDGRSYYPYNLLGAIYYQLGRPSQGDDYFEEALKRGALARGTDNERQSALEKSTPDIQRSVAGYLLEKDAARYAWAASYL